MSGSKMEIDTILPMCAHCERGIPASESTVAEDVRRSGGVVAGGSQLEATLYQGTICRACGKMYCLTCHPFQTKGTICPSCGSALSPLFADRLTTDSPYAQKRSLEFIGSSEEDVRAQIETRLPANSVEHIGIFPYGGQVSHECFTAMGALTSCLVGSTGGLEAHLVGDRQAGKIQVNATSEEQARQKLPHLAPPGTQINKITCLKPCGRRLGIPTAGTFESNWYIPARVILDRQTRTGAIANYWAPLRQSPAEKSLRQVMDAFSSPADLGEAFYTYRPQAFCEHVESLALETLRLDTESISRDPVNRKRFNWIVSLAEALIKKGGYEKMHVRPDQPETAFWNLSNTLNQGLEGWINSLQGSDMAPEVRLRLYDFGIRLINSHRTSLALACFEACRPIEKEGLEFWIFACMLSEARLARSPEKDQRVRQQGQMILDGAFPLAKNYIWETRWELERFEQELRS